MLLKKILILMGVILLVLLFACQIKFIITKFTDKISGLILLNLIVLVSMVKALSKRPEQKL
jgi:hypothetical protein